MGRRGGHHQHGHEQEAHAGTVTRALGAAVAAALATGCQAQIGDMDGVFYAGDGRRVHCAVNLDSKAQNGLESVETGLDRARDRGEIVELYAHSPGGTVPASKIAEVLAGAHDRGLSFVTYTDFARGAEVYPGLALSFDDTSVDAWLSMRPVFQAYGVRATFFVSRYHRLSEAQRAGLRQLAADGHDIEAHSANHVRGPDYVEQHGIDAYLRTEIDPSIEIMRAEGYDIQAFAYPFGARTGELDAAIAKRVPVLRSVAFSYSMVQDPCPH